MQDRRSSALAPRFTPAPRFKLAPPSKPAPRCAPPARPARSARGLGRALATLVACAAVAPAWSQSLALELVASGLSQPAHLTAPPGDPRLFVCENGGRVRVIAGGALLPTPFLDLAGVVHGNEGLASLAFHPRYPVVPYAYVAFLDTLQRARLVRYSVSGDPNRLDPASAVDVLPPQPKSTELHNYGTVLFGPDGKLYLTTGDDVLPNDPVPTPARDLGSLFGKVLRLDVDAPAPHVPSDNPFLGVPGARPEVLAYGLRNPWRASFDRGSADLWIGDVGRAHREEVDVVPLAAAFGADFGWRCREGTLCTTYAPCAAGCAPPGHVDPLVEHDHADGRCAVIGGFVYRGAALPWLVGRYVYGDFCTGEVRTLLRAGAAAFEHAVHRPRTHDWQRPVLLSSFGEDAAGELYLLDIALGRVFRLIDGCGTSDVPCTSNPSSTGALAELVARGSLTVQDDALTLFARPVPQGSLGYYIASRTEQLVPLFGGSQGNLCVGPTIVRFSLSPVGPAASGEVRFRLPLAAFAGGSAPAPGESWTFQLWFRDANPGPTSNTSNALRVTFCP